MSDLVQRIWRLFGSTEGLLIVVTTWEMLLVAFLSVFSGPLADLDLPARLGLPLGGVSRVGRNIMLYHALAIPFVASLVYSILDLIPFGE